MPTNLSTLLKVLAVSLCLSLFQPLNAVAGVITFFDSTEGLTFTLSPDLIASGATGSCMGEVCTVKILPPPGCGPNSGCGAGYGSNTILDQIGTSVSDTVFWTPMIDNTQNISSFLLTFTSDSEMGLPASSVNIMRENGTIQQAINSSLFWDSPQGMVILQEDVFFQSDVTEAPEPSTILLVLIGFAALAGIQGRRVSRVG